MGRMLCNLINSDQSIFAPTIDYLYIISVSINTYSLVQCSQLSLACQAVYTAHATSLEKTGIHILRNSELKHSVLESVL